MTSLSSLPLRDDLKGRTAYGAPQEAVPVLLNVNENAHPVPESVRADIVAEVAKALEGVNRYPDREFSELRASLAAYLGHNITPDQIWAANGSNEVLQNILQAFAGPGRTVLGFNPTYSMYPLLTRGTGAEYIAGTRASGYTLSAESAIAQVREHKPDVVVLCSPNNPTGTPLGHDVITAVYEATDGIVIVDEAYQEFAPDQYPTALPLLAGRERLAISRTMSKAFAFAGARVGYLAADPAFIDALRLVRLPYHLSALTQAAAVAALRHSDVMLGTVAAVVEQRDRITAELPALGYTPAPSATNFVLFGGVDDPQALFTALYERGVLIRDVGIPGTLRVTAGTEEETTAFLEALASVGSNA